ncbi:hypothetical protein Q4604_23675 [Marinovum sp. 1_MG-2023]|nr:hypothetical protein [Marinovum sp. 1_MG-2023]
MLLIVVYWVAYLLRHWRSIRRARRIGLKKELILPDLPRDPSGLATAVASAQTAGKSQPVNGRMVAFHPDALPVAAARTGRNRRSLAAGAASQPWRRTDWRGQQRGLLDAVRIIVQAANCPGTVPAPEAGNSHRHRRRRADAGGHSCRRR